MMDSVHIALDAKVAALEVALKRVTNERNRMYEYLLRYGKHGIHCKVDKLHSTNDVVGVRCVGIKCPVHELIDWDNH